MDSGYTGSSIRTVVIAIYVLSRYLLAERLRPALERADAPVILNLSGTGGIRAGRIHWDDLQLTRGYTMFKATMQGPGPTICSG